jgi:hypothetical protein
MALLEKAPLKVILLDLERNQLVEQKQINGNLIYVATPKARAALLSLRIYLNFFQMF